MNIDVLKDLSPAEPASAGDLPSVRPVCRRSLSLSGVPVVSRGLLPRTGGIRRRRVRRLIVTMPPQHGKSVGASTLLPAYLLGRNPDLPDRHRLLFGFVGFEVQPARAAYHRFARICGLFPGNDHQAGSQASGVPAYG